MSPTYPFPEPVVLDAEVFTELPERHRRTGVSSYWGDRNRRGQAVDSFLEGPSFDRNGNLWFVDIPFGRIFRADPSGTVQQVAEYEGQPNGLKVHRDGRIFIADFQNGIMQLDLDTGDVTHALHDCDTEGFKGCNDLHFGRDGALHFTDQGQTGLQDPTGRVYRWQPEIGVLVCQTGMGLVWIHDALGRPVAVVRSPRGLGTTNCAFGGKEGRMLFITESDSGSILKVEFPEELQISGAPMFSGIDARSASE